MSKDNDKKPFSQLWYQAAGDMEKDKVDQLVGQSHSVLELVDEVLNKMAKDVEHLANSENLYDNPNWAHRQADLIGQKRTINKIKSLTKHLK